MPLPFTLPLLEPAIAIGKSWWKAGVGALAVAAPCFLLGQCDGVRHERNRAEAATAVAVATAVTKDSGLKEVAAGERVADRAQVANLTEELTNAVAEVPDEAPDPVAVALGCQRLRQAGRDVSGLAVCGGPEGGGKALARP